MNLACNGLKRHVINFKGIKYTCGKNWYDFTYHKWMDIIESIMDIVKFGID